ncbi:zinc finger protein 91 [Episyrphus balteatus]|uniref:zinc finger protein 91 n=1 Tax=Episyrphus balteatus TaxID=286459 RepID=UPI002485F4E0|nr:zinc finger protein 91 [Episyrphus balteatus]
MENIMEYRMLPAISTFPQFHRPMSILSPLDLSLRSSSIPITPPSTPSPPRKRSKMFEEQNNIWRPHTLSYFDGTPFIGQNRAENPINRTTSSSSPKADENECIFKDKSQTASSTEASCGGNAGLGGESEIDCQSINISEDETIILTEDENDPASDSDNDEEYVDVLGNDDEESSIPATQLFPPNVEEENINPPKALTRDKLVYEDEELHKKAMDGFAKLFVKDFKNDLSTPSTQTEPKTSEILPANTNIPEFSRSSKMEKKRFKMRKQLSLDEDNTSPVSGTIIRKLRDDEELVVRKGDIDPAFNVVEITEEAKAILASIDNKIGAYLCQLCRTLYDDAFQLAQHRCPRIVHIEYKCSECEKVFNCPANLASHRRWHKPKTEAMGGAHQFRKRGPAIEGETVKRTDGEETTSDGIFNCNQCGKSFRRQAYLKKHLASHQMLDELKAMDSYKQNNNAFPHSASNYTFHQVNQSHHPAPNHLLHPAKTYSNHPPAGVRFPNLFTNFDHRRFHVLSDLYLSHQLDRSSAFQYVQNQNLRGLPMAPMIPPLMQMPVK